METQAAIVVALLAAFFSAGFGIIIVLILRYMDAERKKLNLAIGAQLGFTREYLEERLDQVNQSLALNSDLWMDANHLIVEAQGINAKISNTKRRNLVEARTPAKFFSRLGIDPSHIESKPHQVFVLMPFIKTYNDLWLTISETCKAKLWTVTRSDDEISDGNFLSKIVTRILESGVVICDISTRNPNVYYELGIAHTLNKYVILTARQEAITGVPVDLTAKDIILYKDLPDLRHKLGDALVVARQILLGTKAVSNS